MKKTLFLALGGIISFVLAILVPMFLNVVVANCIESCMGTVTERQWLLLHSVQGTVLQNWPLAGFIGVFYFLLYHKAFEAIRQPAKASMTLFSIGLGSLFVRNVFIIMGGAYFDEWWAYLPGPLFLIWSGLREFFSHERFRPIH